MAKTFARPAAAAPLAALSVTAPAPASAASATMAATSCCGGAVAVSTDDSLEFGPSTSSARCADINVRVVGGDADSVNACVKVVRHGRFNHSKNVGRGPKSISTKVKDGTHFKLRVHAYDTDAQVVPFPLVY